MTNQKIILKAIVREETGKKASNLKKEERIPAVLYGHKVKNLNLSLSLPEFEKILNAAGESTLIDLDIEGKSAVKVIIQEVQYDSVSHRIIHADLYQVKMDEKIRAMVELRFINEAPAVKTYSGILVTVMDTIEIECLPADLVHEIEVDLSTLKTFDDSIHIKDLKIPDNIHVLSPIEEVVVKVQPPKIEKEDKVESTAVAEEPAAPEAAQQK